MSLIGDEEGLVQLSLNQKVNMNVMIREPGYPWMELNGIPLSPDETVPIKLKQPAPMKLVFKQRDSGRPVKGRYIYRISNYNHTSLNPLATTDENGVVTLSALAKDDIRSDSQCGRLAGRGNAGGAGGACRWFLPVALRFR